MLAVAIVSGGLDSTTLVYRLLAEGYTVAALSFDYGQRHARELQSARAVLRPLGVAHDVVDLNLAALLPSALTTPFAHVPEGHYAEPSMRSTVVPNRNAIMLAVAWGVAVAREAGLVALGVHGGDHYVYPDCRPGFLDAFAAMEARACEGLAGPISLYAPFVGQTKADIVREGARLGVPFELTYSCYKGQAVHCGVCGTCYERREAFALAGVTDPTTYEIR